MLDRDGRPQSYQSPAAGYPQQGFQQQSQNYHGQGGFQSSQPSQGGYHANQQPSPMHRNMPHGQMPQGRPPVPQQPGSGGSGGWQGPPNQQATGKLSSRATPPSGNMGRHDVGQDGAFALTAANIERRERKGSLSTPSPGMPSSSPGPSGQLSAREPQVRCPSPTNLHGMSKSAI